MNQGNSYFAGLFHSIRRGDRVTKQTVSWHFNPGDPGYHTPTVTT